MNRQNLFLDAEDPETGRDRLNIPLTFICEDFSPSEIEPEELARLRTLAKNAEKIEIRPSEHGRISLILEYPEAPL